MGHEHFALHTLHICFIVIQVYVFNPEVGACCEEKMLFSDKFSGADIDGNLDTAFFAHYQRKLFMVKGDDTYEAVGFNEYTDSTTTPLPRHNNTSIQYVDKWFNIWYDICEVSTMTEYTITTTENIQSSNSFQDPPGQ